MNGDFEDCDVCEGNEFPYNQPDVIEVILGLRHLKNYHPEVYGKIMQMIDAEPMIQATKVTRSQKQ